MTKPVLTKSMVAAVKAVKPANRRVAATIAVKAYVKAFEKLEAFGDYSEATNIEMAGTAAAAEVAHYFGKK